MNDWLRPRLSVERMAAYSPPTADREEKLRLDFNENTVGCSPAVIAALRERLSADRLAVYPEYAMARTDLAAHFGVGVPEMLLTNGTDEAIQIVVNTFVDPGDEVLLLQPSYAMYRFYGEVAGARIRPVPYREGTLAFPLEELLAEIGDRTRAIFISNPNNPTGTAIEAAGIERILAAAPGAAVLLDEAYFEFFGMSVLPLIGRFPNLFVSRTFSKAHGMAGLRIGCLFSNTRNLEMVHKAQSPYSVNVLAALAARAAISDPAYVTSYVREVRAARELLYAGLEKLQIPFHRSEGNFVLIQAGRRSLELQDKLREVGILVRDRSHEIAGAVRVTVGTREQTSRFLMELERIWDGKGCPSTPGKAV